MEKRKGKSLAELQLEVMESVLEGEKKIGVTEESTREEIIEPLEKRVTILRMRVAEEKGAEVNVSEEP